MQEDSSRREFLRRSLLGFGGGWLALQTDGVLAAVEQATARLLDGSSPGQGWETLKPREALVLEAVADQIWPPDEPGSGDGDGQPGNRDGGGAALGAVRFMDAALGGFMADSLVLVRDGVADLDRRAMEKGGDGFVALSGQQQAIILRDVETTPFFGTVHFLTLCGLFALPAYGGNRDGEGWRQLGFVRQHHWQPPFGHYDAVWRTEGNVDDA